MQDFATQRVGPIRKPQVALTSLSAFSIVPLPAGAVRETPNAVMEHCANVARYRTTF